MGSGQSSRAKSDITISPNQKRSMSYSARGRKSTPKNAAIGPINLSGVTFKDTGGNKNAEEEEDATSFNHSMLDNDDLSYDDESEYENESDDDDSDDEGKLTPRREFLVCDACNKDPNFSSAIAACKCTRHS
jgi:hypothetical protein